MSIFLSLWMAIAGEAAGAGSDFLCYNPPVVGPTPTRNRESDGFPDSEVTFTYLLYDSGSTSNLEIVELIPADLSEDELLMGLRRWKFMVPIGKPEALHEPYRCITHFHF